MQSSQKKWQFSFNRKNFTDEQLIFLYKNIIKPRLIEERMLTLLRQGKITKWFAGIGQEAIAVGATIALEKEDYILPMHRNLGVFTSRGIPLYRLFAQFQGKMSGFTKGRDRSFHFGTNEYNLVGMISHLGTQLSLANGIALANQLAKKQEIVLVFSGEGGTSEGEFHEALNIASVWNLPVIFLIENNGYALSTPTYEQFNCKRLTDKGIGYGMEAKRIDGNNILEVYETINHYADEIRLKPRPILIEAITFRMRGHEEASGVKYVPNHLLDEWGLKDPVGNFERFLLEQRVVTDKMLAEIKHIIKQEIEINLNKAFDEPFPEAETETELNDVYAPFDFKEEKPFSEQTKEMRLIDAVSEGLRQSMEKYPKLVLMGQDIANYGGVFKVTEGFFDDFGKNRVRNTPICESGVVGAALGLSVKGYKAMVEMQFADFVSCAFTQIVNNLAKTHYRWGQNADVVIRMPTGAGVGAGPFHSQSNEAWFFHTPGLKIVYPAFPEDAKGLLNTALADPNPVLFFEHKALYRSIKADVPRDYYTLALGKAKKVTEGDELAIITYGMGVHWAIEALQNSEFEGKITILDLRTLLPWDKEMVLEVVKNTGKILLLQEDSLTGGIMAEIAAWIAENCFRFLDAPIMREGSLDTPVPFSKNLEKNFLPKERFMNKLSHLFRY